MTKLTSQEIYDKGLATRTEVLGADYVQGAMNRATDFTRPLQELVIRNAWGNTWQRDGIDLKCVLRLSGSGRCFQDSC
jgi:4-carboxymuconolactone decarboxylase